MWQAMVPFIGTIALVLAVSMIGVQMAGFFGVEIGEYLWNGENKVLDKKQKTYALILSILLLVLIPVIIFISYLPKNGFPFSAIAWVALVPLGYYTVIFTMMPKKAKLLNGIWGFLFTMSLMYVALFY